MGDAVVSSQTQSFEVGGIITMVLQDSFCLGSPNKSSGAQCRRIWRRPALCRHVCFVKELKRALGLNGSSLLIRYLVMCKWICKKLLVLLRRPVCLFARVLSYNKTYFLQVRYIRHIFISVFCTFVLKLETSLHFKMEMY